MEGFAALLGISIVAWIVIAAIAALALPVAYLWMLVDAIVRDVNDFSSRDMAEKVLWIVVMIAVQPAAVVYFFLVWLPNNRSKKQAAAVAAPAAPAAPTATPAA